MNENILQSYKAESDACVRWKKILTIVKRISLHYSIQKYYLLLQYSTEK